MGETKTKEDFRYSEPIPPHKRGRCHCGCKKRATHRGMMGEVEKIQACEATVQRWVRTGRA